MTVNYGEPGYSDYCSTISFLYGRAKAGVKLPDEWSSRYDQENTMPCHQGVELYHYDSYSIYDCDTPRDTHIPGQADNLRLFEMHYCGTITGILVFKPTGTKRDLKSEHPKISSHPLAFLKTEPGQLCPGLLIVDRRVQYCEIKGHPVWKMV